jgi:hypothetical protein
MRTSSVLPILMLTDLDSSRSDHFPQREISRETISLHKQLVALFQDYEMLTKRIRDQPCEVGETQWRLQQGIARAAGLFIAKEAGIIQASPEQATVFSEYRLIWGFATDASPYTTTAV